MEVSTRNKDSEALHSVEQSAGILRVSHWTIRWRVKHGQMRPVRIGRRLFFETAELLRVLKTQCKKQANY